MNPLEEFDAFMSGLTNLKEPETEEELVEQLALISEAVTKCEKLMLYLATSVEHHEDMLSYLFEYKQLLRVESQLSKKRGLLPFAAKTLTSPVVRKWWKFW